MKNISEKEIIKLYLKEFSLQKIATINKIGLEKTKKILLKNNIKIRKRGCYRYNKIKFSTKEINKIINLYNKNISTVKIGKLFNCSYSTIVRLLKRNNIKIKGTKILSILPNAKTTKFIIKKYKSGKCSREISNLLANKYSSNIIYKILKNNQIKQRPNSESHRKYKINQNYFNKIDDQYKSYLLGFLCADGCIFYPKNQITLTIQLEDKKIVKCLSKKIFNSFKPIKYKNPQNIKHKNLISLTMRSKIMCDDLIKLTCTPRKSLTLDFPTLDQVPNRLIHHFIRGYFDGDGSVFRNKKNKNKISVCIACSDKFAKKINLFLIKNNIKGFLIKRGKITNFRIKKYSEIKKFKKLIYKYSKIHLNRKKYIFDTCNKII